MEFTTKSIELTKSLTKVEKKDNGIYFTPKTARARIFELLKKHRINPKNILEPSFGSGEFLTDLYSEYPKAKITGVEKCKVLYDSVNYPNLHDIDFMEYEGKHDLVIGNPPFVVIPQTEETKICQSSRPNLFVQFIWKSVTKHLNPGGHLAFVLPTAFYNCSYYEKMRRYLFENTTVLEVESLEGKYLETQQDTFLLLLKLKKGNNPMFIIRNDNYYLTPYWKELNKLLKDSYTLKQLGFTVKTGEVVWNQEKDKVSDEGILLIHSLNFKDGVMKFPEMTGEKKQYINGFKKLPLSGKSILINRGYGNTYSLNCVLVDYPKYYAENHVNVIRGPDEHIDKVLQSLKSENTGLFIKYFVGNGALSKTELESCIPIWLP
jgi:adenine-specific DNA-methyltransferase